MRYYSFKIKGNENKIKKALGEDQRGYFGYDEDPIPDINGYVHRNLVNNVGFFIYKKECDGKMNATMYFDEKAETFETAFNSIVELLSEKFGIKQIGSPPEEITMHEAWDSNQEGQRRVGTSLYKFTDSMNVIIPENYALHDGRFLFTLNEKIIPLKRTNKMEIYSQDFLKELSNIEKHSSESSYNGNAVHYVISSRGVDAACDMTETLAQYLAKANRISGRRMQIITEIDPDIYVKGHLENIIENNYGGIIVLDLTEKFGYDPASYKMACAHLENLVKKYRNKCLFVFTYNMDSPGFSYFLLPKLKKYIIPVMLKEGTGNRKAATSYMRRLIKSSEYSQFSKQTNEFMKQFQGDVFTQSDVLECFEQFEPWCLNKNFLKAYDYNFNDDFMLDRDENVESSQEKLDNLIGLKSVKTQIKNVVAQDAVEKERKNRVGNAYQMGTMHMVFGGNPGTGKTVVARLFAGIAKEKGVLKSGAFVECSGAELEGLGAKMAIRKAFITAEGGVLFIDEAYSLCSEGAITTLIQEMENHRNDVIVILAGYEDEMRGFMELNEGLKSRIPYWINFPDYSADELTEIFNVMVEERGFTVAEDAVKEARYIFEKVCHVNNFGNGRYVRNLIDHALQNQSVRLLELRGTVEEIKKKELFTIIKSDISELDEINNEARQVGDAKKELKEMVGLSKTKDIIQKAMASFKLRKLCMDKGIARDKPSLHMVFTGNPGTAKTTVARLFAEILKDENVLPTGAFVEVGRAELIGQHVGTTAPLVKRRFAEAQGGVLFIDEAYSLCDGYENGYGDEAINTIVQEMENHRDDVIVIFAGYPDKMKHFLERNPGLQSRIAFQVEFEDYSVEELCKITRFILDKKGVNITKDAMAKLKRLYENAKESSDFGNGRFVRKTLEEAEMNLAERLLKEGENNITEEKLTTIQSEDIPDAEIEHKETKHIGFCA